MTAATIPVRPTIESVTAARSAFTWAYRGDLAAARAVVDALDEQSRTALCTAAALLYHLAEPAPAIQSTCCNGTGFADYAAVPCPAPDWPGRAHDRGRGCVVTIRLIHERRLIGTWQGERTPRHGERLVFQGIDYRIAVVRWHSTTHVQLMLVEPQPVESWTDAP